MSQALSPSSQPSKPPEQSEGRAVAVGRIKPLTLRQPAEGAADPQVDRIINDFQSDTAEIIGQADPLMARATLFVLFAAFIIGVTWAAFAPLDRIVSARGLLSATAGAIVVQPYDTAIVRAIAVKEGDVVKAGAVLATLDSTFSAADLAQLELRLKSVEAQIERLTAESLGAPYQPTGAAPEVEALQFNLWTQRQREYEARLRAYDENLKRLTNLKESKETDLVRLKEQQALVDEIEDMRRKLVQAETGSKLNLLLAQRESINISRTLSSTQAELEQAGHQIQSIAAEREVYVKQWSNQISNELIRMRDERNALSEQITKARKKLELVQLTTPVDAVVVQVTRKSVGSVVSSGEQMIRLSPLNAPLEVEAYITGRDIGYVKVGAEVNVKIDAYPFVQHGMLEGRVMVISEDAFADASGQGTSYKTRIAIMRNDLRNTPETFRLLTGMPLTAEIKVGKRSVLSYFLSPLTKGLQEGLREP